MIGTIINPNFTIVMPGGCNANCNFCFWRYEETGENYLEKLQDTMNGLPSQFYQLSISGGEPTISPYFVEIMNMIDTEQFTHRILTTNGYGLMNHIDIIKEKIHHINISRHHWDDEINAKIFGTDTIPSTEHIIECIDELNKAGIDVTFSAVLTDEYILTKEDIIEYVQYAKRCGASHIYFRKKHENLLPHDLEKDFGHSRIISSHDCPACRTRVQLIKGIDVHWKTSVLEPSDVIDEIFETIFNASGIMTRDWMGQYPIDPLDIYDNNDPELMMKFDPQTGEELI